MRAELGELVEDLALSGTHREFDSTVVLLVARGTWSPLAEYVPRRRMRLGEPIGTRLGKP